MDLYKKLLNKCGKGGIKCNCCKPKNSGKKDRHWSRKIRRMLKQTLDSA